MHSRARLGCGHARVSLARYNPFMADRTLAKLIDLISSPAPPEWRRAAALVAGRIGTQTDSGLIHALLASLGDNDIELRLAAIDALGRLHADEALGPLEDFARAGGPELEAAVQAAGL